jgi:hypothetical protein
MSVAINISNQFDEKGIHEQFNLHHFPALQALST